MYFRCNLIKTLVKLYYYIIIIVDFLDLTCLQPINEKKIHAYKVYFLTLYFLLCHILIILCVQDNKVDILNKSMHFAKISKSYQNPGSSLRHTLI